MLGFETIGNATLIAHDGRPVLATDPWLGGDAYFGSWQLPNEIPEEQLRDILRADFIWLSHGHPDHLDAASLEHLHGRKILLPGHVGNRIRDDLLEAGFEVSVLPDRRWVRLSENVRVLCISDYFQDAVLLVDVGGTLLVNLNDASDRGWGRFVKRIIRRYPRSFLLKLFGYGDVDMMNFFDEDGRRRPSCVRKRPIGEQVEFFADLYGVTDVVPFSCFHRYQRSDSIWANEHTTPLTAFTDGFTGRVRLHDAFVRFDARTGSVVALKPAETPLHIREPIEFGDDWSEPLEREDVPELEGYFQRIGTLSGKIDFVRFRVGGVETTVDVGRGAGRGITFESPRASLLTAARHQVFDDLLIGNFVRTTLHGDWSVDSLHPHFTPYVAKFADNGHAHSQRALRAYFRAYRQRAPLEYVLHVVERESERRVRRFFAADTPAFRLAKRTYLFLKGGRRGGP